MPQKCFGLQVFAGRGWLFEKMVFSRKTFGISKSFQAQKPF